MGSKNQVFVYGTLQYPSILTALINRVPTMHKAVVHGYKRYGLTDYVFPAVVEDASASVDGLLLTGLSEQEMVILDEYEGDEYRKEEVEVNVFRDTGGSAEASLEKALLYVWMDEYKHLLNGKEWNKEAFESKHFDGYYKMVSSDMLSH
ncbi:AIG2-like protein C [Picochlorum sp. SENEW3]|nr:AIG2-like protein C [Picochlorum sp. SENEW3]